MENWLPERDYHEDLVVPRLIKVGGILRNVWRRVSELHEVDAGDNMWSLSCRAFVRCGYAFSRARKDWPWLSIIERRKMQWILSIGVIPVRFYHGDPLDVPDRYSSAADIEHVLRQGVLNLDDRIKPGILLRFVTETDSKGIPLSVKLIEYEEASDEVLNTFTIPEADAPAAVAAFPQPQPKPGIIQPKPAVRPRTGRVKGQTDDAE